MLWPSLLVHVQSATAAYNVALTICSCLSIQVHETELALMVPNADLANHAFQHNATYALKAAKGSFELTSCRPISAGDAACISYGADKTNAELMRDYGAFMHLPSHSSVRAL